MRNVSHNPRIISNMANDKSITGKLGNPMAAAGAASAEREAGKKGDVRTAPLTQKARGSRGAPAAKCAGPKAVQK
jgi:hypothetical protein